MSKWFWIKFESTRLMSVLSARKTTTSSATSVRAVVCS